MPLIQKFLTWWQPVCGFNQLEGFRRTLGMYLTLYYIWLLPSWISLYGNGQFILPSLIWTVGFICSLCLVDAKWGRIPFFLLWFCNLWILHANRWVANGEERVMAIVLFYALWLPWYKQKGNGWSLRTLQAHLAMIYVYSVLWKITMEPAWLEGSAIYYALQGGFFPRWTVLSIALPLTKLLTWGALVLQALFPLALFIRRIRPAAVGVMMLMHLGIGLIFEGLWLFNLAMIASLAAFLVPARPHQSNS